MLGLTSRMHPLLPALALVALLSVASQPAQAGVTSFFVDLWGNLADAVSMSGQAPAGESTTPKPEAEAEPVTPTAAEALLPPIKAAPVKKVETEVPAEPKPAMPEPIEAKAEPAAAPAPSAQTPESGPVARGMHRVANLLGGARREENLHGLPVR